MVLPIPGRTEGVSWPQLNAARLPTLLRLIIERNRQRPPVVVWPGMPLYDMPVDHLAFALDTKAELQINFDQLVADGDRVIDSPRNWPEGDGCPAVPWQDQKWMATVALEGYQVTLLAPKADGDVISTFLKKAGGCELHHIAFLVPDIRSCLGRLKAVIPSTRQITVVADDDPMSQVFCKFDSDVRIVELVERRLGFEGSFTCNNVTALTAGERKHSFSGTEAAGRARQ